MAYYFSYTLTLVHRVPHTDLLLPRPNVKCLVHDLSPPSPPSAPALCRKPDTVDVSEKAASGLPHGERPVPFIPRSQHSL